MKTATSPSNLHSRCGGHLAGFLALALAALLGTAVAPAQTASPASHPATPAASARPQAAAVPARHGEEEETEAKPNDASHQGIKIHGHWKIDIKNPDGSLASTHELENSLYDHGTLLSYLLTGRATPGEAEVQLLACASATSCPGATATSFYIAETSTGYWSQNVVSGLIGSTGGGTVFSPNLNVSLVTTGSQGSYYTSSVVLTGSAVAPANGVLIQADTAFASCINPSSTIAPVATVSPAQCHSGTAPTGTLVNALLNDQTNVDYTYYGVLTMATLPKLAVLSGQTIQVTVTLSFS